MVSKLRHFLTSLSEDHLLKLKKKNTIFGFLGLSKQTLLLSKIIIPKTIQYIKFVVAVYFYYDEDLMLLFLGLLRQKNSLNVGEDPALSNSSPARSLFNSSSFRTDSFNCPGIILLLLLSHAAFPTNSRTSAFTHTSSLSIIAFSKKAMMRLTGN